MFASGCYCNFVSSVAGGVREATRPPTPDLARARQSCRVLPRQSRTNQTTQHLNYNSGNSTSETQKTHTGAGLPSNDHSGSARPSASTPAQCAGPRPPRMRARER